MIFGASSGLSGAWTTISGILPPGLLTALALVGVVIIVLDLLRFFHARRHSKPTKSVELIAGLVLGITLIMPGVVFPVIFDILNTVWTIASSAITGLLHQL